MMAKLNKLMRVLTLGVLISVPMSALATEGNSVQALLLDKFQAGHYSNKGADGCLMCHKKNDSVTAIFAGVHGDLNHSNSPMAKLQCESCHGPQGKHRGKNEPMISFAANGNVSAELQDSVCLSCHQDSERMAWHDSLHVQEEVSCVSCHSVHTAQDPIMNRSNQVATCVECHSEQRADMHKRSAHPILGTGRDGGNMVCSDCHAPHGSLSDAALKQTTINDSCYDCHAEKRGPFLWEHESVIDDCSSCHDVHGSVNDNLLKRKAPQLCQNCHQPDGHQFNVEQPDGVFTSGQSCLNCHNQIHGSNHPSGNYLRK
ncbi:DmsE family decaheme c-type cytochrome [Ferrimonas lipolytica]|uniref:DmsE family decaheme c-type cytochrome n=1 Tax=Ferrimonas lipolytica TaxID=2724191 RepID=A0A6H1UGM0_9GAMM|nr:DmsE family decaheme c-type cytochrome [Ferrimonas lipolytica]QIZ78255.1 DmsE family decaheme c-type cytochrome [Ferrimonas lipolytica]